MSGGVDSSTAACLLKEEGYDVIGVTMHIWPKEQTGGGRCCTPRDVQDARQVSQRMGFPYYLLDLREEFKRCVIDDFVKEYQDGRTPNPCIRCNEFMKFGVLLKKAIELEAEFIATGHYVKVEYKSEAKRHLLLKGKDEKKEQSYFLYSLKQDQLARTKFPLGEYTKDEVRELARDFGLRVSDKKGSQEICFIDERGYSEFLRKYIPDCLRPGKILDRDGRIIGEHKGIAAYTIGQRKGIGLARSKPYYVMEIRPADNTVIVADEKDIYGRMLMAEGINVVAYEKLPAEIEVTAKIRYQSKPACARAEAVAHDRLKVIFKEDQWAITPGQAVVLYQGDLVVGGGRIVKWFYG